MKTKTTLIFCLLLHSIFTFGQCDVDSTWKKGFVKTQFDKAKKLFKKTNKNIIQIVFREGFRDSVISCYNGEMINKSYVVSDIDSLLGSSNTFYNLKLRNKDRFIMFLLPQSKKYVGIRVAKGYKYLDVYKYNEHWTISYRNKIAVYE